LHFEPSKANIARTTRGGRMYAVFAEVNADESATEDARTRLSETVAPAVRKRGAKAGYWLAPQDGRGISLVVFDSEEDARQLASIMQVGEKPAPDAPEGITVRTVEVREVLASV
jgi:hypothetical protein